MDRCNQGVPWGDTSLKRGNTDEWERDRNFKSILTKHSNLVQLTNCVTTEYLRHVYKKAPLTFRFYCYILCTVQLEREIIQKIQRIGIHLSICSTANISSNHRMKYNRYLFAN